MSKRARIIAIAATAVVGATAAAGAVVLVLSATAEPSEESRPRAAGNADAGPERDAGTDGGVVPPGYQQARRSFAHFIDGQLDECVTMTYVVPKGEDPAPLFEKVEKATTPIDRDCSEQFKTRTTYAGCSVAKKVDRDGGPPIAVSMVAYYFRTATAIDKDAYMKQCFKTGGDWREVEHGSPSVRRERLRESARELREASERLSR